MCHRKVAVRVCDVKIVSKQVGSKKAIQRSEKLETLVSQLTGPKEQSTCFANSIKYLYLLPKSHTVRQQNSKSH